MYVVNTTYSHVIGGQQYREPRPQNSARMSVDRPQSRFERRPGPNADPLTRRDETLAFAGATAWTPPDWFERVIVVLYETTDVVNLGGVVRTMANTGFTRLRLVRPVDFDPWDVVGVAHYTHHIVDAAERYDDLDAALADAEWVVGLSGKHHRDNRNQVRVAEAQERVAEFARAGGTVALLFGREDHGLPNEALDRCHALATIPTNPAFPSLNLAQATLLTLYGLFQRAGGEAQPLRAHKRASPPAPQALLEDLFADLGRALDSVEFFKPRSAESTMRSLRALLFRARLDVREASLLRAASLEVRRHLVRRGLLAELGPVGARRRAPNLPEPPGFDSGEGQMF